MAQPQSNQSSLVDMYLKALSENLNKASGQYQATQQRNQRGGKIGRQSLDYLDRLRAKEMFKTNQAGAVNNPPTYQQTYPTPGDPTMASASTALNTVGPTTASAAASSGTQVIPAATSGQAGIPTSVVGTQSGQTLANATMASGTGSTAGASGSSASGASGASGASMIPAAYLAVNTAQPGSPLFPVRQGYNQISSAPDKYVVGPAMEALGLGSPSNVFRQISTFANPFYGFENMLFGDPAKAQQQFDYVQQLANMQRSLSNLKRGKVTPGRVDPADQIYDPYTAQD